MSSDEPPRPVLLTDELRAQLNSVSTATLTNQLQRKGIRSTFLSGLKPIKPGQRMLGYAHTLRYVPIREDLNAQFSGGQNAQRRAVESMAARRGAGDRGPRRARRRHVRRRVRAPLPAAWSNRA